MEGTTIREPEQIRRDCSEKLLRVIRGPKLRAVLGYFLGEVWAIPIIADLRLTSDGRLAAIIGGKDGSGVSFSGRDELIRSIHSIAQAARLDGDELGYLLAQVAKIKKAGQPESSP
jgi:hypothetical protein